MTPTAQHLELERRARHGPRLTPGEAYELGRLDALEQGKLSSGWMFDNDPDSFLSRAYGDGVTAGEHEAANRA